MQEIFEKAGLFYLGKDIDPDSGALQDNYTLIKNKWLTTHAAIIGMTGSGKTGLGITLIEEAAIDNIPVVVIDPKGDMGDLCLVDPRFSTESFLPWVKDEAKEQGEEPQEYAKKVATKWQKGIRQWNQDDSRVARYASVEKVIYTPGSNAGVGINILSSLDAPPQVILDDSDSFASYLKSTVSSILALIGEPSNTIESKSYILIAKIIAYAWRKGESLTIESLIGFIMKPPFKKVGVLSLERFFPAKARIQLATKLNALLASPGFEAWLEGDSLDMQRMLYDKEGKGRVAIFSIAHLRDEERMFFVTLLLNRYIAWMRRQSGTSRLRAMLYMDEIFGFFPPNANPPSKEPMLLLLKQARAFGVGVVLSTQNPVDLDYKGLANIGTWFIGRLQTKQDIKRIIDGMEGKVGDSLSKEEIEDALTKLKQRVFFLRSAHLDALRLFTTRWVMSYLKGPLRRDEIEALSAPFKKEELDEIQNEASISSSVTYDFFELIDASIPSWFEPPIVSPVRYRATLQAKAKVHFFNQRKAIDTYKEMVLVLPLSANMHQIDWQEAQEGDDVFEHFLSSPPNQASFEPLPDVVRHDKKLRHTTKLLKAYLYRSQRMQMWRCDKCKLESYPEESYTDFMARVDDWLTTRKENEIEKLQLRYEKKEKRIQERISRAQAKIEKEKNDTTTSVIETGIAILGALFGRTTPTKLGRTLSKGSRVLKEHGDVTRAQEQLDTLLEELDRIEEEFESKLEEVADRFSRDNYPIKSIAIAPKKNDIEIETIGLVWVEN